LRETLDVIGDSSHDGHLRSKAGKSSFSGFQRRRGFGVGISCLQGRLRISCIPRMSGACERKTPPTMRRMIRVDRGAVSGGSSSKSMRRRSRFIPLSTNDRRVGSLARSARHSPLRAPPRDAAAEPSGGDRRSDG
jgi:hypothetical protein